MIYLNLSYYLFDPRLVLLLVLLLYLLLVPLLDYKLDYLLVYIFDIIDSLLEYIFVYLLDLILDYIFYLLASPYSTSFFIIILPIFSTNPLSITSNGLSHFLPCQNTLSLFSLADFLNTSSDHSL